MADSIGHFKILGSLGSGGLGDVFRARDTRLGRTVAVKVLPTELTCDPVRLDDLRETALRLIELSHPNITMMFEGGEDDDQKFLVFEYVQGESLRSIINGRALGVRRALEYAINLADALAAAHAAGMVHGDIRPDTIVITPKERAKFMNFGLWRFTAGGAARLTAACPYASPEELAGRPLNAQSDIYALGAVLFEMLTGRQRVRGLVLTVLNTEVPAELERTVTRMLAGNVENREQSAATVAAELRSLAAVLDTRTEAEEVALASKPVHRRVARTRSAVVFAIVLVVVLAGALAAWLL